MALVRPQRLQSKGVSHYFACRFRSCTFSYRCIGLSGAAFGLFFPHSRIKEFSCQKTKAFGSTQSPLGLGIPTAMSSWTRVRGGMPPVIICVACNGGIQGKEANEFIPETADEIAESVQAAYEAGAAMVHIHARDPQQLTRRSACADTWRDVLRKVRATMSGNHHQCDDWSRPRE